MPTFWILKTVFGFDRLVKTIGNGIVIVTLQTSSTIIGDVCRMIQFD